jgi:hypothetical protein
MCAFNNKPPGYGRSDRDYLELFIQVFGGAPKDMTVAKLNEAFATSMALAQVYKRTERREKKDHTPSHEAVPNSASVKDSDQIQAHRPTKTNRTAVIPDQPLKDTTNLKPKPKTQSLIRAAPTK